MRTRRHAEVTQRARSRAASEWRLTDTKPRLCPHPRPSLRKGSRSGEGEVSSYYPRKPAGEAHSGVRERKCPVVPGTQVAQGWASSPGFHPPPRATLMWLHPRPSPSKAGPERVSHSGHGQLESGGAGTATPQEGKGLWEPGPGRRRWGSSEPPCWLPWAQLLREKQLRGTVHSPAAGTRCMPLHLPGGLAP